jgi:hypothetical protein
MMMSRPVKYSRGNDVVYPSCAVKITVFARGSGPGCRLDPCQNADGSAAVYTSLELRPIINAAGTYTHLGGSLMPPEVIKAMEDVETVYSLGKMKYQTKRIKPFFHSRIMCDPENPWKIYPGYWPLFQAQYQKDGKTAWVLDENGNPEEDFED